MTKFDSLKGLSLASIDVNGRKDVITFVSNCGRVFRQYHKQDCCEHVSIEDICGDLDDLIGSPILLAEESTNRLERDNFDDNSVTWTFYKLSTIRGSVTIRWHGSSNGYYSESVDFMEIVDGCCDVCGVQKLSNEDECFNCC